MSHRATNWLSELDPGLMSHAEFRVMFHLCDCHNPSMGCFPRQSYLIAVSGLSSSGLNKALNSLEEKGLVFRSRNRDGQSGQQKPTHYILGFDLGKTQEPTPLSGDGPTPLDAASPTPLDAASPTPLSGVIYKEEPVKEPVKEPCVSTTHTQDMEPFFKRFVEAHPRVVNIDETRANFWRALQDGADPEVIIRAARAYREEQKGNKTQYISMAENWLSAKRWEAFQKRGASAATQEDVDQRYAEWIKGDSATFHGIAARTLPPSKVRDMIACGLVSEGDCKRAGVVF